MTGDLRHTLARSIQNITITRNTLFVFRLQQPRYKHRWVVSSASPNSDRHLAILRLIKTPTTRELYYHSEGERGASEGLTRLSRRDRERSVLILCNCISRARAHHTINALRTLVRCREGYNPTRCNAGCNTSISRRGKCANSRVAIPA